MAAVREYALRPLGHEYGEGLVLDCLSRGLSRIELERELEPYFHDEQERWCLIADGVASYWDAKLRDAEKQGKDPSKYVDQVRRKTSTMLEGASYYGLVETGLNELLSKYEREEPVQETPIQRERGHEYEKYLEIFDDQISKRGVDSVGAARMTRSILLDSFAHRGIYNSDYGDPNRFRDYSHIFDENHYERIKEIDEIMRYCLREKGLTELENDRMIVAGYDFDKGGRGPRRTHKHRRTHNHNEKKIDLSPVISKAREYVSKAIGWFRGR